MRKIIFLNVAMLIGSAGFAYSYKINGINWEYSAVGNTATILSCSFDDDIVLQGSLPSTLNGFNVTGVADGAFMNNDRIVSVIVPGAIRSIGNNVFRDCKNLRKVVFEEGFQRFSGYLVFCGCTALEYVSFPSSFVSFYGDAEFQYCNLRRVDFHCAPPQKITSSFYDPNIINNGMHYYTRQLAGLWIESYGLQNFGGYLCDSEPSTEVVSSSIRENDPTVMDIVYKVTSSKPTVKIRVLAFEDGERSFAKVVRPETFVDGTAPVNWDAVEANVEHTLSWKVSSDWATRLAKVKFEILACDGELLPLEFMTIPASDQYGAMKISWNAISQQQWFDALLWLYADHDSGLTLVNGVLKNGATELASGATAYAETSTRQYISGQGYVYTYYHPAVEYVYSKMGYSMLSGNVLNYANQETRLGLSPSGARQYAYKMVP